MPVQQPNFSQIFGDTFCENCHPIEYTIRDSANFLHDMAFMSSLIHDARVHRRPMAAENGIVEISIERDCWEIPYVDHGDSFELHVSDSVLIEPCVAN